MPKPLMPWCAVSVVAMLLGGLGLPALKSEAPAVLPDRKGGSPLDRLDGTAVPDRLPKEVVALIPDCGKEPRVCAFTPDGQMLAVADDTGTVRFWCFGGRSPKAGPVVKTAVGCVMGMTFAPDGKTLALSGDQRRLELWDSTATPPRPRVALDEEPERLLRHLTFDPSGKLLAGAWEKAVYVWEVDGPRLKARPPLKHKETVHTVTFSPDGRTLATAGRDAQDVFLWEVATGRERTRFPEHDDGILAVHFAADGRTLASAARDGEVRTWELATEEERGRKHLGRSPTNVAFSSDGKVVGVARVLSRVPRQGRLPHNGDCDVVVQWGNDKFEWRLPASVDPVTWAPDGRHLALAHSEGHVYILRFPR